IDWIRATLRLDVYGHLESTRWEQGAERRRNARPVSVCHFENAVCLRGIKASVETYGCEVSPRAARNDVCQCRRVGSEVNFGNDAVYPVRKREGRAQVGRNGHSVDVQHGDNGKELSTGIRRIRACKC